MKIILPLHVSLPRKKSPDRTWILNLNSYRNTHFHILNTAKKMWGEIVTAACIHAKMLHKPPYVFIYTIYPNSNRKFDLGNVCSIIQKFTDDALIELGIITDDSYKIIPNINYRFGGVDKENPRAELEIISVEDYNDLPF